LAFEVESGLRETEFARATRLCPSRLASLSLRYDEDVATSLDREKLHDVLDQAVVVIDEQDLERSRHDPRVRAFHDGADKLLAELEAEGADYS
jgi:hypothetical protein